MNLAQTFGRKLIWGCAPKTGVVFSFGASTIWRRAKQAQLGVTPLRVEGTRNDPRIEAGEKSHAGGREQPIKMLKMKVDPEMCMKTKDEATNCPTQKMTFLPGCTPFYTEMHVFCGNCRLCSRYLSIQELTPPLQNVEIRGGALLGRPWAGQAQPLPIMSGCGPAPLLSRLAKRPSAISPRVPNPVSSLSKIADFRFKIPDSESRALRPIVNRQSKIGISARIPFPACRKSEISDSRFQIPKAEPYGQSSIDNRKSAFPPLTPSP
jgi:hypothetical protein